MVPAISLTPFAWRSRLKRLGIGTVVGFDGLLTVFTTPREKSRSHELTICVGDHCRTPEFGALGVVDIAGRSVLSQAVIGASTWLSAGAVNSAASRS